VVVNFGCKFGVRYVRMISTTFTSGLSICHDALRLTVNCSNRAEKGVRLFRFPRDEQRRARWVANVKRDRWTPTASSYLCEVSAISRISIT